MSILSKEQIREMIKENNYQKPGEILSSLKEMFKDVLQEMRSNKAVSQRQHHNSISARNNCYL